MLTSCNHTFCSICIRRALSNDGKCPMCRASEQEIKLRGNWSMGEAVEAFTSARRDVLDFARKPVVTPNSDSPKRKLEDIDMEDVIVELLQLVRTGGDWSLKGIFSLTTFLLLGLRVGQKI